MQTGGEVVKLTDEQKTDIAATHHLFSLVANNSSNLCLHLKLIASDALRLQSVDLSCICVAESLLHPSQAFRHRIAVGQSVNHLS